MRSPFRRMILPSTWHLRCEASASFPRTGHRSTRIKLNKTHPAPRFERTRIAADRCQDRKDTHSCRSLPGSNHRGSISLPGHKGHALRGSQPWDSRCGDGAAVREIAARSPSADRVPIKGGYAWPAIVASARRFRRHQAAGSKACCSRCFAHSESAGRCASIIG